MAIRRSDENPKTTDKILFRIYTPDAQGSFRKLENGKFVINPPHKINAAKIYFIERSPVQTKNMATLISDVDEKQLEDYFAVRQQVIEQRVLNIDNIQNFYSYSPEDGTAGWNLYNLATTEGRLYFEITQKEENPQAIITNLTNNSAVSVSVIIGAITYTILSGNTLSRTDTLTYGQKIIVSSSAPSFNLNDIYGSILFQTDFGPTPTIQASPTPTSTPIPSGPTPTPTYSPSPTPSTTPSPTPPTPTPTMSPTPTPSASPTSTPIPTFVNTSLILDLDPANYSGSGTTWLDTSGTNNTGTLSNVTYGTNPPRMIFNGSNSYVYTTTQFNNPTTFSICAWFRTVNNSGKKIVGFENNRTGNSSTLYDRHVYVNTEGYLAYSNYSSGSGSTATSNMTVTDWTWRHLIITNNGSTVNMYLDNVLVGNMTKSPDNKTGYWRLGSYNLAGWPLSNSGFWPGEIGRVSIYNKILTTAERTIDYNAGALTYKNLVRFTYTGSLQTWTVPSGVYSVTINARGATGGSTSSGSKGGSGANVTGTLAVTPGATLYVVVGGTSTTYQAAYGFGGNGGQTTNATQNGGAGGGLSGVFTSSTPALLTALIIAGGGGGAGARSGSVDGGAGGMPNGANGQDYNGSFGYNGGYGATTTAPGNISNVFDTNNPMPTAGNGINGGNGGTIFVAGFNGGGGGGAGAYGGGGGSGGGDASGAGGGGSSYVAGTPIYGHENKLGHGSVTITYG